MTQKLKFALVAIAMIVSFAGQAALARGMDAHHRDGGREYGRGHRGGWHGGGWHRGGHRRGKFMLKIGICAGQKLAAQGIKMPEAKPGERPKLDDATRKAVWDNVKACRDEFRARWRDRRGDDREDREERDDEKAPEEKAPEQDGKEKAPGQEDAEEQEEDEEIVGAIMDM